MTEIQLASLDFEHVKEQFEDRWERANVKEAHTSRTAEGTWAVQLPEGDQHSVVLGRRGSEFLGWCDCDGFSFHTNGQDERGPCAHLCVVRKMAEIEISMVPNVEQLEADVGGDLDGDEPVEPDVVDHGDPDEIDDVQEERSDPGTDDDPTEVVVPERDVSEIETTEEFVEEISGVPPAFVVDMGRGENSRPYITKEGLNYIAYKQGLEVRAEPLSPTWEDDAEVAAWRGIVTDEEREWSDVGTAHLEEEDMEGASANLDELASTRATNRALRLATGAGMASIEELDPDAEGPIDA